MDLITNPSDMASLSRTWRRQRHRIGVVPTMGYLHDGHLSLVRLARQHADRVILTLFVNPTQFGPSEDLSRYPRNLDRDLDHCRTEGVDVVFAPDADAMYATDHSVTVNEESLSRTLCGASRPGHFRGVTTVVTKLFNLTQPDLAVFGEKDAQQVRVIRRMVRDLNFPVKILSGPIIREPDGVAMSSRNVLLSEAERTQAICLRRALDRCEDLVASGIREADALIAGMEEVLRGYPLAAPDYLHVVDNETLEPVKTVVEDTLVALAVRLGATRLIDNTVVGREGGKRREEIRVYEYV